LLHAIDSSYPPNIRIININVGLLIKFFIPHICVGLGAVILDENVWVSDDEKFSLRLKPRVVNARTTVWMGLFFGFKGGRRGSAAGRIMLCGGGGERLKFALKYGIFLHSPNM